MSIVDESQNLLGKTVGGCRLDALLGSGGMGAVYRGRHLSLDKDVAVKLMSATLADNKEYVSRFVSEARLAAQLEHSNIVQVLNVGCEGGLNFIVMQFVDGQSLSDRIKNGPLSPRDAVLIALAAAQGIAAAHKKGIVHRDIKPANILLTPTGEVKVADMGLAKVMTTAADSSQTQAGTVLGTPDYMPPEQAEDARSADARNDIYSLGCTLYHMLIGAPPFIGKSSWAIIQKHMTQPVTPPHQLRPDIPQPLSDLVVNMMAKNRNDRPQTMVQVIKRLEGIDSPNTVIATTSPRRTSGPPEQKKSATWIWIACAAVVVVLILAAIKKPTPAQQAYEGAHALWQKNPNDYEGALAGFHKVVTEFPNTPWAEKAKADEKIVLEARGKAAYENARTFWKNNPNDYETALAGFQKIANQFPDSTWAEKAIADANEVSAARESAASQAFDKARTEAGIAAQQRDYPKALKVWENFPTALLAGGFVEKVRIAKLKARLPIRISEFWSALQKKDHETALKYLDPEEVANSGRKPMLDWMKLVHGVLGIFAELEGIEIKQMNFSDDLKSCNIVVIMKVVNKQKNEHEQKDVPGVWMIYKDEWYAKTK